MHGLLSSLVKFGSFRVLRHTADSWLCVQTLPSYKNAYALVTESEKGTQFMLAVFSKSIVLRTKVPFNKSEVIAVQVQFDCQFGSVRFDWRNFAVALAPQIFIAELLFTFYNFQLDYEW